MSVMTWTTPITKREDVSEVHKLEVVFCVKHWVAPKVYKVYTGKKKKYQGTTVECGHDECLCFGYEPVDAIKKWNEINSQKQ